MNLKIFISTIALFLYPISMLASPLFNNMKGLVNMEGSQVLGEQTNITTRPAGTNIRTADGTIYFISKDGQRRPYTSAGAFLSYRFNKWAGVLSANDKDLQLPIGPFIPPRDGSIACSDRGADKGTCYVISEGSKIPFPSEQIFKAQGYNFANALNGDVSFLPVKPLISSGSTPHAPGSWISIDGTVYVVAWESLWGVSSPDLLEAWGVEFRDIVPATVGDRSLPVNYYLPPKNQGELNPLIDLADIYIPSTYNFNFLQTVLGGADFIITNIVINPAQPVAGQPATLQFSIKNIGQSPGERPRYTVIDKPKTAKAQLMTGECFKDLVLQPGQHCTDSWHMVWDQAGQVKLNFIANTPQSGEDYKPEADYNNNKTNYQLTVRPAAAQDTSVKFLVSNNLAVDVGQMYKGQINVEALLADLNVHYLTFYVEGKLPEGVIVASFCNPAKPRKSSVLRCALAVIGVPKVSGSFPIKIRGVSPTGEIGNTTLTITVMPSQAASTSFTLLNPQGGEQIQHGQAVNISWLGGNENTVANFSLLRQWNPGEVPEIILNDPLEGKYNKNTNSSGGLFNWVVSPDLEPDTYFIFGCLSNVLNTSTCLASAFTPKPFTISSSTSPTPYLDSQRLQEVAAMAIALELYFNDRNSYPESLNVLVPGYLKAVPVAPMAGGTCNVQQNDYTYTRLSNNDYKLTFCLAGNTNSYQAGPRTLSPAGIK